ncbi:MAG: tripartite tricarboxylate transporter permease [Spirochaetota bacterium]|nr:tripartite tricarboxylate transporter permease [Spirochaetota bacterium]
MTDVIAGAVEVFSLQTLLWVALGEILGIILGSLPGLTATMGIALMLPISFHLPQVTGMGLLLGVYCGAVSGASIPAILLGIPGNPNAIATVYDGQAMTNRGMAGQALGGAVIASFLGGIGSLIILVLFSPLIARFTLMFGPAEKATLALVGLTIIASVSSKQLAKGVLMGAIGVALALLGPDPFSNRLRIPFRGIFAQTPLAGGVNLIPALIGLFGISQALVDTERIRQGLIAPKQFKMEKFFPLLTRIAKMWRLIIESLGIGTLIGAIPGTGASIAVYLSYERAKKVTKKDPKLNDIGTGRLEGVVAPEVANNAVTGGALIPALSLGIPGDSSTAVLLSALLIQGVVPGYRLFSDNLSLVYAIFLSLLLANIFMLLFQYFGVRLFPKVLSVPIAILVPAILVLSLIGSYAIQGQAILSATFDMGVALVLGIVGYFLKKADYPIAPIVLGLILGGLFEENFRRAVKLANGDYFVFFTKPISVAFILLAVVSVLSPVIARLRENRR